MAAGTRSLLRFLFPCLLFSCALPSSSPPVHRMPYHDIARASSASAPAASANPRLHVAGQTIVARFPAGGVSAGGSSGSTFPQGASQGGAPSLSSTVTAEDLKRYGSALFSFGAGDVGQLGTGQTRTSRLPVMVQGGGAYEDEETGSVTTAAPICMVSAGGYHTILVDRDGAVFACGQNTHGQLGIGRIEYSVIVPELLEETEAGDELPPVHGTSTGTYHTLLLAKDGQVYATGANEEGQLGLADVKGRCLPSLVQWCRVEPRRRKRPGGMGDSGRPRMRTGSVEIRGGEEEERDYIGENGEGKSMMWLYQRDIWGDDGQDTKNMVKETLQKSGLGELTEQEGFMEENPSDAESELERDDGVEKHFSRAWPSKDGNGTRISVFDAVMGYIGMGMRERAEEEEVVDMVNERAAAIEAREELEKAPSLKPLFQDAIEKLVTCGKRGVDSIDVRAMAEAANMTEFFDWDAVAQRQSESPEVNADVPGDAAGNAEEKAGAGRKRGRGGGGRGAKRVKGEVAGVVEEDGSEKESQDGKLEQDVEDKEKKNVEELTQAFGDFVEGVLPKLPEPITCVGCRKGDLMVEPGGTVTCSSCGTMNVWEDDLAHTLTPRPSPPPEEVVSSSDESNRIGETRGLVVNEERPRGDVREIGLLPALEFGIDSEYSSGGDDPLPPAPPVGSEAPEAALKAPRFKAVAAGHLHSLLLCEAGRVWACGNNDDGQLGVGDKISRDVPTRVRGLPRCSAVAAGSRHSVALSLSGAVFAWGLGSKGQLGVNDGASYCMPVCVMSDPPIVGISAGNSHTLLLDALGTVWACGNGQNGRLGLGNVESRHLPTQITSTCWTDVNGVIHEARAVPRFAAAKAGYEHSLLLDSTGRVFTFGAQESGKLGMGDSAQRFLPAQVMGLPKAFSISAGHYHNLVLVRGIDAEIYHRQFVDAATRLASDEESRHRRFEEENARRRATLLMQQQQQAANFERMQQLQQQHQQGLQSRGYAPPVVPPGMQPGPGGVPRAVYPVYAQGARGGPMQPGPMPGYPPPVAQGGMPQGQPPYRGPGA